MYILGDLIREMGRSLIDYNIPQDQFEDRTAFLDVIDSEYDAVDERSNNDNRYRTADYDAVPGFDAIFDKIKDDDTDLSARKKRPKNPTTAALL
jgi:hypothetical protein